MVGCQSTPTNTAGQPVATAAATPAGTVPVTPVVNNPAAAVGGGSAAAVGQVPTRPVVPSAGSNAGDIPVVPNGAAGAAVPPLAAGAGAVGVAGAGAPPTGVPVTPGTDAAGDWRMMGYDLGSTYLNTAETAITKETAAKLDVAWTADMGGNVNGGALQIGDKIYATAPGSVRGFDAASGMQLWKTNVGSTSTLGYADGTLFINDNGGKMVALSAADGKMLWSKAHDKQMTDGSSSAIPVGDVLLIGGSNGVAELSGGGTFRGYVSALNRMTGDILWTTYTVPENARGASFWSSLSASVEEGLVFGGSGNNYGSPATDTSDAIIAFDLKTGAIKWKNKRVMGETFGGGVGPDSDFGANPVLYETMVAGQLTKLVADGAKGGTVHALRRDSGMLVWTRNLCRGSADGSQGIFTNFGWTGKDLIVACNEGGPATLYALNGATGEISWMRKLSGQVFGRTAFVHGVGFVGTGTSMEAFDVATGAVIKSWKAKGTIASTITVAHGRVAFGEGLSWSSGVRGSTLTVLAIK